MFHTVLFHSLLISFEMSVRGANTTSGIVRLLLSKAVLPGLLIYYFTILKALRRTDLTPKISLSCIWLIVIWFVDK